MIGGHAYNILLQFRARFRRQPSVFKPSFFPVKDQPFLMEVQLAVEHSSCMIRYILHPGGFISLR
jgi:hypothetical protein